MSRINQQYESELRGALGEFEQRLEVPIVPGEMENWMRSVHESSCHVAAVLLQRVDHAHGAILREILREDTSLAARVEQLEEEDEGILARAAEIQRTAENLLVAAAKVEPHEGKLENTVRLFTEDALQLVLRIRKQEAALETWYQEAFLRDRGVVD
jgi:hypothetical protein